MMPALIPFVLAGFLLALALRPGRAANIKRLHLLLGDARPAPAAPPPRNVRLPLVLARPLRRLGVQPAPRDCLAAIACAALPVIPAAVFLNPLLAGVLAVGMLLAGYASLQILAARHVARLGAALPGFFDRVRQLLSVGNSLPTAFTRAVGSAPPHLAAFFAPTLRRMGNGAGLAESVQQCAEDIDLYEMRLFAAAIATHARFGGSLTHALDNLVTYLRRRASVTRELRAATAEIRASAWVLGLLPLLVGVLIMAQNPAYAHWFLSHAAGRKMLAYGAVSQIVGTLAMRAIVRTAF
jgi:tight adherence protein B